MTSHYAFGADNAEALKQSPLLLVRNYFQFLPSPKIDPSQTTGQPNFKGHILAMRMLSARKLYHDRTLALCLISGDLPIILFTF